MKIHQKIGVALLGFATVFSAHARPLDAIGKCAQQGAIELAGQPYSGDARVMKSISDFISRHSEAAIEEEPWLKSLIGKSGKNRVYSKGEQRIVIITLCNSANCEKNRAYIAYEPKTGSYGASLYEDRHVREIGATPDEIMYPPHLGAAIICAQNLDWGSHR